MSNFDGTIFYNQFSIEDQITHNLIDFLNWGMLEIGAFYNIRKGQKDSFGNNISLLRPISIQNFPNYQIFGGLKHNWVWETGVIATGNLSPINISGIYINNTFYPNGTKYTGVDWHVDYSKGWVYFNSPIGNQNVEIEHSLRHVNFYSSDSQFFPKVISDYTNDYRTAVGSGLDNVNIETRTFMPAVFLEIKNFDSRPIEIGSRSKYAISTINFEIFATNAGDRKRITDLLYNLEDKSFKTYNINNAPRPLSISGTINGNAQTWPTLSNNYFMGWSKFNKASLIKDNSYLLPIQHCSVRLSLETPIYY